MASSGLSLLRRAAEAVRRTPRWQKRLVFFTVGYVHRLHLPYAFPLFFVYCFSHPRCWLIDPCASPPSWCLFVRPRRVLWFILPTLAQFVARAGATELSRVLLFIAFVGPVD